MTRDKAAKRVAPLFPNFYCSQYPTNKRFFILRKFGGRPMYAVRVTEEPESVDELVIIHVYEADASKANGPLVQDIFHDPVHPTSFRRLKKLLSIYERSKSRN